ncbi:uncharacterized protein LDX57_005638 [Aspergillus melleus]|uniref:uncharacterized protein n=1 Tax=Aspergillus melleus TaxID=138277 RepID=UPI001E8E3DEA|nr:uncharacterized protein LDX57_005638 [Aspergillus melleus]KAH8427935.1 hypothetical protein LDX57_005638 [Aspergillus melleus]
MQTLESLHAENTAKLAEKEGEVRRLHEVEAANGDQVETLQQELNIEKEKLASAVAELCTTKNDSQKATLELEAKLESLQADNLRRNEHCKSLVSELSAANSAKENLESGKSNAKAEIYALLRRVQDAESRMKNVKETLDQMRSTSSQETITDAWSLLNDLLQLGDLKKSTDCHPMDSSSQVKLTSDVPVEIPSVAASQGDCRTPARGALQTTEFIYRTESIQRSLFSSPNEEGLNVASSQPVSRNIGIPDSQSSAGIIPFSSIRQQISPARRSTSAESFVDFAIMSGMIPNEHRTSGTPDTTGKAGEPEGAASQVADSQPVEETRETITPTGKDAPSVVRAEPIEEQLPTKCLPTKHKTVKFQSQDSGAGDEKRQYPAPDENEFLERTNKPRERKLVRTNQRTYSRTQQLSYTSKHEKTVRQQSSSRIEETSDRDGPGRSRSNIRKTTASAASSATRTQSKGSSEYPERKASPASLASGSSKYPSAQADHPNSGKWTRGSRGRKARGT